MQHLAQGRQKRNHLPEGINPLFQDTAPEVFREERWIFPLLLLLAVLSLVPIWITPIPPLQDLPNHLLKVDIIRRYLGGDAEVRAVYALNFKLLSNYLCYVVIFLLAPVIGLLPAAKVFISGYLLALPLCTYAWLRRVNPRNAVLALAVPALSYSLFLSKGNLNFCAALAMYVGALAVFSAPEEPAGHTGFAFGVVATLLYFTHGFVFLALTGAVTCLLILEPKLLRRALGLAPGLICFAIMIISESVSASGRRALQPAFNRPGWYLIRDVYTWLFEPYGRGYESYFALAWVTVIACCGLCTCASILAQVRNDPSPIRLLRANRWLVVAVALGAAYALAPVRLTDWGHLGRRFIPLAALTTIGALQIPRQRTVRRIAAAVFVISALITESSHAREYMRGSARVQEYIGGIGAVEAGSSLLPIDKDDTEDNVRLNLHSWAYYHLAKEGWSPYLHAYPSYHPVVYRKVPWAPEEDLRGREITTALVQRAAACYDYILVWAPDEGDVTRVGAYFDLAYQTSKLRIWRNRGPLRKSPPGATHACLPDPDGGPNGGQAG